MLIYQYINMIKTKTIKILLIFLLVLPCFFVLTGCKKEETSEALFITSGELYSDNENEGIIIDGMVYFASLGIDRSRIREYGFLYSFDCPEKMLIGDKGVTQINCLISNLNHLSIIINVNEACYNKDLSFRMYIKYHEINSEEEKVLYSESYGACNLYELAKNDPSDFAKRVVTSVENK